MLGTFVPSCTFNGLGSIPSSEEPIGSLIVSTSKAKLGDAVVVLHTSEGEEKRAFCDSDGSFEFSGVTPGSHMAQAHLIGHYFPEVRLDVSPKAGLVRASFLPPNDKQLGTLNASPLVLHSLGELQYFEKRKPIDIVSILKSPYGIMIAISLFAIIIFPKMKVDPEEYKEFQQTIHGGGSDNPPAAATQGRIGGGK
eukprot:gene9918-7787_t